MPATVEEPVRGFAASDFTDPPPDAPPFVPRGTNQPPPEPVRQPEPAPAADAPDKPDADPMVRPLAQEDDPEAPTTMTDALTEPEAPARTEDGRFAAEKKTADDAAAAEAEKAKAAAAPPAERDADLKIEHGAHTHPNTRKKFDAATEKTRQARDERDAAIAKAAELEKRAVAAEERANNTPPPKELVDRFKQYEERIRELDITHDPLLKTKYDAKIEANNRSIVGVLTANLSVLKEQGFGMAKKAGTEDFVEVPGAMDKLVAGGLTLKALAPFCKVLEDAGLIDEAESVREALRENFRTARDKQAEIESWKVNHATRLKERETATKQQQETTQRAYAVETDAQLRADREAIDKDFPFVNPPPAPLATDTAATAKAKQAALDQFNAETKQIETAVKAFNPAGVAPEKMPEFVGRFNAAAISSVVLKTQVIPRLKQEMAALTARNKELEADLAKIRGAGRLSREQSMSPSAGESNAGHRPEATTMEEALGRGPGT